MLLKPGVSDSYDNSGILHKLLDCSSYCMYNLSIFPIVDLKDMQSNVSTHQIDHPGEVFMFEEFSREQLEGMLQDAVRNWLTHDGLWFLAVEDKFGLDTAIELDAKAWEGYAVIEAKRIIKRHQIAKGGGIPALADALGKRMYSFISRQEIVEQSETRLVFRINECRVQSTRERKGLPAFPCKPVGIVEFSNFAKTIDPRIETRCISCPPDVHPKDWYCSWEFTLQTQHAIQHE
jgi:hypothetical protein